MFCDKNSFLGAKEKKIMLAVLEEFRERLDYIMLKAMHSSVLLYGYESYTGRFIKWYAKYYHNIDIDYLVSTDMNRGRAYDSEIFRPSIIDFDYKNVRQAMIWIVEPMTEELRFFLENRGYSKDKTYFDFYEAIYGNDIYGRNEKILMFSGRKKKAEEIFSFWNG